MKRIFVTLLFIVTVISVLSSQDSQVKPGKVHVEQAKLTKLVNELMTTHAGSTADALKDLDHECAMAMIQGNIEALALIEYDDFTFTGPDGTIVNKKQDLETIKSGDLSYDSITLEDVSVRVFQETGVVTGKANVKGHYRTYDISGPYRYTVTFVKLSGRWRAVASQMTRIQG